MQMTSARVGARLLFLAVLALVAAAFAPAIGTAQDAFKDAKKDFESAKKENSATKMGRAVDALGAAGSAEARDYLIGLLEEDQKARKNRKPGWPGDVRKKLIAALGNYTDDDSVAKLGAAILKYDSLKEPAAALDQYDLFYPLAGMDKSEAATNALIAALGDAKNPYIKVAALEAIRRNGNHRFVDAVCAILREDNKEWWSKWKIVPINVFACLESIATTDTNDAAVKTVEAVSDLSLKWSNDKFEPDERVRFFGGRMLRAITGENADITSWQFWKWWAAQKRSVGKVVKGDKTPEKRSKTAPIPPIFNAPPVGTRFVFCIDVSLSMKMPLKINLEEIEKRPPQKGPTTNDKKDDKNEDPEVKRQREEEEKRIAEEERKRGIDALKKLPWKSITTKMELAREELARAIESLPDKFQFAIVTYSTEVDCKTPGFVTADAGSRAKWAKAARELEPEALTNIHGGLMASLRLNKAGFKLGQPEQPSVDEDCVINGADTIIFLTDGWGSWSDDSNSQTVKDPRGGEGLIGDGTHILGPDIWPSIARHNLFRKVIINCVGIGYHDAECLRHLARDSGGTYVDWGFKE